MPELIPAAPGGHEWHFWRKQGVTATDIVAILGLSSYDSAYSLYWRKLGQVPDEPDNDRFRLGRELENYVARRWQEATGLDRGLKGGLARSSIRPWQMATLDQQLVGGIPLECKTWADADRHSWADGPPAAVRAQVLWQMDVMDVETGYIGVLFLPSGEFRSLQLSRSSTPNAVQDIEFMRERGAEFYARLRGELPPPDIDASEASQAAVKARFSDVRRGKVVPVSEELWGHYSAACDQVALAEAGKRAWENKLRELTGEAAVLEVDGEVVARRRVYDSPVKAHTRHVDGFWRVKQQGDGDGS